MVSEQTRTEHETSPLNTAFLASVSHAPGVYLMVGKREVLYVGKARDLRKRLAQYVHFSGSPASKTGVMLRHVRKVETILTTTEKEALILEASLIKKHRPRYNVILRDDKNYPLIKLTVQEKWPRVVVTRKRLRDGNRYFGPYAATGSMRATLKLLFSLFPLRRCKTLRPRSRPCLNYQMRRCLAPCCGLISMQEYAALVQDVEAFLEGKNKQIIRGLEQRMRRAAEKLEYEQAALYRDQIRALEKTLEQQVVAAGHMLDQDVYGLARQGGSVAVALLFVRQGMVSGSQSFFLEDPLGDDGSILTSVLMQYYGIHRHPPREILLPAAIDDPDLVQEHLSSLRQTKVHLRTPKRGRLMQLMRMARANAEQIFSEQEKKEQAWQSLGRALRQKLRLRNIPERIECVDISNLAGDQPVGSLVCFVHGNPEPSRHRHYRINTVSGPDDYAMMREMLERRMKRGMQENEQSLLPDLLLVDGGKGHLGVALDVVQRHGLQERIDLVAIAKEKSDEGEKLFRPGRKNPILLPSHSPALRYLMRIRDETHRFGITFHRKLRGKQQLSSSLDRLRGVGPGRRQALLRHLGSYRKICQASEEELARVPGIGKHLARSIFSQLHEQDHDA